MAHWLSYRGKENEWTLPLSIMTICRGNCAEIGIYQIPPAGQDPAPRIHWNRLSLAWSRKSFSSLCQQHLLAFSFGFQTHSDLSGLKLVLPPHWAAVACGDKSWSSSSSPQCSDWRLLVVMHSPNMALSIFSIFFHNLLWLAQNILFWVTAVPSTSSAVNTISRVWAIVCTAQAFV